MSICVFGDSIAWGAYDPINGGWVTLLRNYVEQEWYRLNDKSVYNLAICGETTASLLPRFDIEFKAREPEIVIFALGINDSAQIQPDNNNWVTFNTFQNNLVSLSEVANKFHAQQLFVGLTPLDESKTTPLDDDMDMYYQIERDRYNRAILEHCQKHNFPHIDLTHVLTTQDLDDGLHPNSAGHHKIFKTVLPVVEKMLLSK